MAETLIIIAKILSVTLVFLSCALFISFLLNKFSEGFGSSGIIEGVIGIGLGVVVGAIAGGVVEGGPGSHLGGLTGGAVGVGVVYVWLTVVRLLHGGATHSKEGRS